MNNWKFERSSGYAGYRCQKCSTWLYEDNLLICSCEPFKPKPRAFYAVLFECRVTIIEVSPKGDSFFALGTDAEWDLTGVESWIREIDISDIIKTYKTVYK